MNQHRAANGLAPLTRAAELDSAALRHSTDMATNGFFSHTGSDGSSPGQRMNAAGYYGYTWGENIAAGYSTAAAVMNAWMNSAGHRANILNSNFKEIGIAVVYRASSPYRYYWTQDFGARSSSGGGGSTTPPPPTSTPDPQISSISPTSGPSGTTITITGADFGASQGYSRVMVRSANRTAILGTSTVPSNGWSDSRITVQIRPSSTAGYTTGQYHLWVRRYNASGTSYQYSNAKVFTFQ